MSTRRRHATLTVTALLTAAMLPLAGCATPFGSDDPTTTTTTSKDPGRQLSEAEAEAALPAVPVGGEVVELEPEPTELETTPAECLEMLRNGESAQGLKSGRVARVRRGWNSDSPAGSQMTVSITSHSEPVSAEILDRAGAAMSTCGTFTYRGKDRSGDFELNLRGEPRTVDPLGDQTFADRITVFETLGGQERKIFVDQLIVRSGNNLVHVNHSHWDESASHEPLEAYARGMLDALRR